jgi:hypothetical protein
MQNQAELRVSPVQILEKQREQVGTQGRDDAKLEATHEQALVLPRQIANLIRFLQYSACPNDDALSDRRDIDVPAGPLDEGYAKEVLKLAKLDAERGLSDVAAFRRMAKMPEVGHRDQVAQLGERHRFLPLRPSMDFFDFFDLTNQAAGAQSTRSRRFASRREDTAPKKTVAAQVAGPAPVSADCGA